MFFIKSLSVSILFILLSNMLHATVYENADNKKNNKWKVLQSFELGVVSNIYDKTKRSRVIKLKGEGTKSAYLLMRKKNALKNPFWKNKKEKFLHWDMKYSEEFVILIGLETTAGKRFLIYTSGEQNSYMQYGLGYESTVGKWEHYQRNLQEDLEHFELNNSIISVNSFVIRGSGLLDNIKLTKNKKYSKKKKLPPRVENNGTAPSMLSSEILLIKKEKSHTPIIYINGDNPMILKKGEKYKELGAIARDENSKELVVNISHAIDVFVEGEYSVLYMATDSLGNSVIDKRRVRVGNISEKKEKVVENSEEKITQNSEDQESLENRELEMMAWERELLLREKEIAQKESRGIVPGELSNQPLRPGL